jgi:hypothetical protein
MATARVSLPQDPVNDAGDERSGPTIFSARTARRLIQAEPPSGFAMNGWSGRTRRCPDRPTVIAVDTQQLIAHQAIALCLRLIVTEAGI